MRDQPESGERKSSRLSRFALGLGLLGFVISVVQWIVFPCDWTTMRRSFVFTKTGSSIGSGETVIITASDEEVRALEWSRKKIAIGQVLCQISLASIGAAVCFSIVSSPYATGRRALLLNLVFLLLVVFGWCGQQPPL